MSRNKFMIPNGCVPILENSDFNFLKKFSLQKSGIILPEYKKDFICTRLVKRINLLHLDNFLNYYKVLKNDKDEEEIFLNLITNRHTDFFRESHHFDFLKNHILPDLRRKKRKIRIWSAGCATGEEAYSIAMILDECGFDASKDDIKILATDINSVSLATASAGIYPPARLSHMDKLQKTKYFSVIKQNNSDFFQVNSNIADYITFRRLNFIDPWPMQGSFDVIFFRNVAIYFERELNQHILNRMMNLLDSQGFLMIGHSESLLNIRHFFDYNGKSIYQKKI